MRHRIVSLVAAVAASALLLAGCGQSAAPVPTQAPAAPKAAEPTKAAPAPAEPTKAQAPAQAIAAPAKKADWPEKGKTVSLIIPYAAGGGADIAARLLAGPLEKALGTPVQVANKAGGGSQVGVTAAATAKPDGYTVGYANWPTMITLYLDPDRKAAFGRKDLQAVALHVSDPMALAVKAGGKFKNLQELVDYAKANPEKVKVGTGGIMSPEHFTFLMLEKLTGAKFSIVHFDGGAPAMTALLGDHLDAVGAGFSTILPHVKSGGATIVATMEKEGKQFLPEAKTLEEQGYKGFFGLSRGWFVPKDTPKEIVTTLSAGIKTAMESEEHSKRIAESGHVARYMGPEEFGKYWDSLESTVKPLIDLAKQSEAK